jgi:hypothetical protein
MEDNYCMMNIIQASHPARDLAGIVLKNIIPEDHDTHLHLRVTARNINYCFCKRDYYFPQDGYFRRDAQGLVYVDYNHLRTVTLPVGVLCGSFRFAQWTNRPTNPLWSIFFGTTKSELWRVKQRGPSGKLKTFYVKFIFDMNQNKKVFPTIMLHFYYMAEQHASKGPKKVVQNGWLMEKRGTNGPEIPINPDKSR